MQQIKFKHLSAALSVLAEPEDNPVYIGLPNFQELVHSLNDQLDRLLQDKYIDDEDVIYTDATLSPKAQAKTLGLRR